MKKKGNDIVIKTLAGDLIVYVLGKLFQIYPAGTGKRTFFTKTGDEGFFRPEKSSDLFLVIRMHFWHLHLPCFLDLFYGFFPDSGDFFFCQ